MVLKALVVWVGILVLAMLNGLLREAILMPALGTRAAQLLSGMFLSALILIVAYIALPWLGARRLLHRVAIGLGWLGLTLVFEFSFGLYQGKSWPAMLGAYRFEDGNLWPVVLFVTFLAPVIAGTFRRNIVQGAQGARVVSAILWMVML